MGAICCYNLPITAPPINVFFRKSNFRDAAHAKKTVNKCLYRYKWSRFGVDWLIFSCGLLAIWWECCWRIHHTSQDVKILYIKIAMGNKLLSFVCHASPFNFFLHPLVLTVIPINWMRKQKWLCDRWEQTNFTLLTNALNCSHISLSTFFKDVIREEW